MSNSTPRAALPPLPKEPQPDMSSFAYSNVSIEYMNGYERGFSRGWETAAEQVEQIRRETVMACAEIAGDMDYGDSIKPAILALLPVKDQS